MINRYTHVDFMRRVINRNCLWRIMLLLVCAGFIEQLIAEPPDTAPVRSGASLYTINFQDLAQRPPPLPLGATFVKQGPMGEMCLRIEVIADSANQGKENSMLNIPLDLSQWKGMQIMLVAQIRAEAVTQPAQRHNGVKLQLYSDSPSQGKQWQGANGIHGSFSWKEVSVVANIGDDSKEGQLQLGLQGSSGAVWISDVRIVAWRVKPKRPEVTAHTQESFRGHSLPRLRGVMGPNIFRVEDFDALAKWNVNVIRWQMTRAWGKANTDTDLAEYDQWLNGKLDELAKVLDAAAARGIKVVVDLHSPPGGRLDDSTMRMFVEKKYQDHFVAIWERIARRFKGNPAIWGYDLVNEPVQKKPSPSGLNDWYGLQEQTAKVIRAIDAEVPIIFEVDYWDAPGSFAYIQPIDVSRVIYQVHMYAPMGFTHQGVLNSWGYGTGGQAGVTYPGLIDGKKYDREMLRKELNATREFQLAYNVHIFVGEFSAARWAPGASEYLDDCIAIFEEYGWDWAYHAFREWPGWSVEHVNLPYDRKNHPIAEQPTDRFLVLKKWFDQNHRADTGK